MRAPGGGLGFQGTMKIDVCLRGVVCVQQVWAESEQGAQVIRVEGKGASPMRLCRDRVVRPGSADTHQVLNVGTVRGVALRRYQFGLSVGEFVGAHLFQRFADAFLSLGIESRDSSVRYGGLPVRHWP